jgi:hypothetical protein
LPQIEKILGRDDHGFVDIRATALNAAMCNLYTWKMTAEGTRAHDLVGIGGVAGAARTSR